MFPGRIFFFFLTKVGGSRDLFLFKRLEKCCGVAVRVRSLPLFDKA